MISKGVIAGTLLAAGLVFTIRGGCLNDTTKAPDERLVVHLEETCKIARANISTPVHGVRKLGAYMSKHTGQMFGDWGDTLAAIERIPNDDKHDARARLARDRIRKPLRACEADWARFAAAVDRDPQAAEMVERFSVRFNRTIEIIFSGVSAEGARLLDMPKRLDAMLEQLK